VNCEQFEELAGAYALGALDGDELREAEEHLRGCERHPEVAELLAVAAGLALDAPEMDPPPALRSRLMEAVRADAVALNAREPAEAPAGARQSWGLLETIRSWLSAPRSGYALSGALAVLVGVLVVWNLSLQGEDGGSDPMTVSLSGQATGQVIFLEDEGLAVMEVDGLTPLPAEQVYQVWAISDGQPTSLGLLEVEEDGEARGAMRASPDGVDQIAVTVEAFPGAELPTSQPVISGRL
jgi:anti-sigma-K factor RskA